LTGVDSLAAKLNNYTNKIYQQNIPTKSLASRGVVERVSEVKKVFALVRLLRAGYADCCQRVMIAAQLGASRDNATQKVTELSFHKPFFVKGLFALVPAPIDRGIALALRTMKRKLLAISNSVERFTLPIPL
jgi:hypothetical protein